jgi:hypothetical protein
MVVGPRKLARPAGGARGRAELLQQGLFRTQRNRPAGFRRNFPFQGDVARAAATQRSKWKSTRLRTRVLGSSSRWASSILRKGTRCEVDIRPASEHPYLRLQEKGRHVETIRVSEELNLDVAPDVCMANC